MYKRISGESVCLPINLFHPDMFQVRVSLWPLFGAIKQSWTVLIAVRDMDGPVSSQTAASQYIFQRRGLSSSYCQDGFVIEVCTRACPVSMHNTDGCRVAQTKHTLQYTYIFVVKTLFLPCTIFLSPVPSHLPKTHTTSNIPPPTHTVLSSLDVSVHDSLAANPLVGWMNVYSPFIIRLIRHLTTFFTSASSHTDN